ncbi:MAG: complex I NDUFA9 subunit family protein [Pseudomonadota bacterium]
MKKAIVFGGSGFVGRQIVRNLCKEGYHVLIAVRDCERALRTKTAGNVGQIAAIKVNISNSDLVMAAVKGCDVVVNATGILAPFGQSFHDAHTQGACNIALAAKKHAVGNFIHISALGVSVDHPSHYAKSKAAGEKVILEEFPSAVILRPSVIFGPGDGIFERFDKMARFSPILPVIGSGANLFQPVYVGDVADAICKAIDNSEAKGKIFELGGPDRYSFRQILTLLITQTKNRRLIVTIPFFLAYGLAIFGEIAGRLLGINILTLDQLRLLRFDNIVGADALTLEDLSITPKSVQAILPGYLSSIARNAFA